MTEQRSHTRMEEALAAVTQAAETFQALSTKVAHLAPDQPGLEAKLSVLRNAYNHERDRLAVIHDSMRRTLLSRYPAYKNRLGFFPGRLGPMPGFKPAKVLENYQDVIDAAKHRAQETIAFLEESQERYQRANALTKLLWRLGWMPSGYSLYRYRRLVGVCALVVVAALAIGLGVGLTRGGGEDQVANDPTQTTTAAATLTTSAGSPGAGAGTAALATSTTAPPAASSGGSTNILDLAQDPHESSILQLVADGVIRLKPDQQGKVYFHPEETVERAEFLTWLDRVSAIPSSDEGVPAGFYSDLTDPLRQKAIDAYANRIIVEWPAEGGTLLFHGPRPILARDALAWCVRYAVRLLPADKLAEAVGITTARATDYRSRISMLTTAELDRVSDGLQLEPAGGFASANSVTRSEAAALLVNLKTCLGTSVP